MRFPQCSLSLSHTHTHSHSAVRFLLPSYFISYSWLSVSPDSNRITLCPVVLSSLMIIPPHSPSSSCINCNPQRSKFHRLLSPMLLLQAPLLPLVLQRNRHLTYVVIIIHNVFFIFFIACLSSVDACSFWGIAQMLLEIHHLASGERIVFGCDDD